MGFTISQRSEEIHSCDDCLYISTAKHFADTSVCPLCRGETSLLGTHESDDSMPAYRYHELKAHLEESVNGVGAATVSNIDAHFADGDSFLATVENAYDTGSYEELTCIDGVGDATAENIALGLAAKEGWTGGLAESKFSLS